MNKLPLLIILLSVVVLSVILNEVHIAEWSPTDSLVFDGLLESILYYLFGFLVGLVIAFFILILFII